MSTFGGSSHTVKRDESKAAGSASVLVSGNSTRTDSWGRHWEAISGEKESCKASTQLDGSSALRRSGDASDSSALVSKSSEDVETAWSPLAGCPSGDVGTLCSGRWKIMEGSAVSLWVISASIGWKESESVNGEEGDRYECQYSESLTGSWGAQGLSKKIKQC